MLRILMAIAVATLIGAGVANAQETWSCPDAEQGRKDFLDGTMQNWPNYSETHGARVQRQHPRTVFTGAQAKFIERDGMVAGMCQYYNHIGLVANSLVLGSSRLEKTPICDKKPCPLGPYWRYEFIESLPEHDKLGQEQMLVCMEDRNGLAYPSVGCGFLASKTQD